MIKNASKSPISMRKTNFSQKILLLLSAKMQSCDVLNSLVGNVLTGLRVPVAQSFDKYQDLSDFCEYQIVSAAGRQPICQVCVTIVKF